MKFLYIALIVLAAQQVVSAIHNEFLKEFFESPHWKQSLAFDAPVISAEETLKHLKKLLPLLPKNKNVYLDENERTGYVGLGKASEDLDWDRNEEFGFMRDDLAKLIDFSTWVKPYFCLREDFRFLYVINEDKSNFADPEKEFSPYGPNIKAYLNHYRTKVLELCRDGLQKSLVNVPVEKMEIVKDLASKVKATGIETMLVDNSVNDGSLAKIVGDYLKNKTTANRIKGRNLKHKYETVVEACLQTVNGMNPMGFLDIALQKPVTSAYIYQDEFLSEWAFIYKMCSALVRKVKASDLK